MSPTEESLARLQETIRYSFADLSLLSQALRHKSAGRPNNERLEFLGDAILGAVVAEALFRNEKLMAEGNMTLARSSLVSGESLAQLAYKLELDARLTLGKGERKGGAIRASILEDAIEALIGAVFLDSNYETARRLVHTLLGDKLQTVENGVVAKDPKTELQELMQSRRQALPVYRVIEAEGPAHERLFTVSCSVDSCEQPTQARAGSRREAEREAARAMLTVLATAE